MDNKKEMIMHSFLQLVAKFGIAKVTMLDVAKELGLTKSAIYYYFKSKEELIVEAINLTEKEREELLEKMLQETDSPKEHLIAHLNSIGFSFSANAPAGISDAVILEMEKFIWTSPAAILNIQELMDISERKIADTIIELKKGAIDKKTAITIAKTVSLMLKGYFLMRIRINNLHGIDSDEFADGWEMINKLLVTGIENFSFEEKK
jgi:AcrR family transcriptional regulator